MPRPRRRAILRGSMLLEGSRRRRFLFRVDPDGLLAVRIGNPLAFSAFVGIVLLAYLVGWPILGPASILAGGALGLAALGVLENSIARAVAGQPREAALKSRMNLYLSREDLRDAKMREGVRVTHLETTYQGARVDVDITSPMPEEARRHLAPLLPQR